MKFINKVNNTFDLKALFAEHLNKFSSKHEAELTFLEDIRNFIVKKNEMEIQYAQSLSKLCEQYLNKKEYDVNSSSESEIYIPEKWKMLLEHYNYCAQKKLVSSKSMLMMCDLFKTIKEQKQTVHQQSIECLKTMQQILMETNQHCESAFRSYCFEQLLCDQFCNKTKTSNSNLNKKLKAKNLNEKKFKKALEETLKSEESKKERMKKLDFAKLNYVTTNICRNQQLQYYFSMEIPELMHLQNAQTDEFLNNCLDSTVFKDLESSKFLIKQFEDCLISTKVQSSSNADDGNVFSQNIIINEHTSETFFINTNRCFNSLIQFDLQACEEDQKFEFSFQRDNMKALSEDYTKWSSKLNELEQLMKNMLIKLNEKRLGAENSQESNSNQNSKEHNYDVDRSLEQQRFQISEKKMSLIQLQAKIDALGFFNINLRELEQYSSASKFEENRIEFDLDLHQNLELWDTLMKSIDDMHFSEDSYDVDVDRKTYRSDSVSTNSSSKSSSIKLSNFFQPSQSNEQPAISIDPTVTPRYAKTIREFKTDEACFLSFENDQSLIIYDRMSPDSFKARDFSGRIGIVKEEFLEFYTDEPLLAKSVYSYDGAHEQELSFPAAIYLQVIRKNIKNKNFSNEEWWEGVYEDRIGFFPSIFVELINETVNFNSKGFRSLKEEMVSIDFN